MIKVKNRKGISNLLAVVITISIALAAGAFLFAWSIGWLQTSAPQTEVQVEYARLVYTSGSGWKFTINVKNTGTVSTSDVKVYIPGLLGEQTLASTIEPGETSGGTWSTGAATVGKSYTVFLKVTFQDGSYKEYQFTVVAEQG